jgi:hypothetical protein
VKYPLSSKPVRRNILLEILATFSLALFVWLALLHRKHRLQSFRPCAPQATILKQFVFGNRVEAASRLWTRADQDLVSSTGIYVQSL